MERQSAQDSRRRFLLRGARIAAAAPFLAFSQAGLARLPDAKVLSLVHTHTGENLSLVFALGERYLADALSRVNWFLRDHYTGEVGTMDPRLLDQLFDLKQAFQTEQTFHVISGYRCPATNAVLRRRGGGVARNSLHVEGRAIDIRLPGVALGNLRDAALAMNSGGVGYYPTSDFVHIDTGRARSW